VRRVRRAVALRAAALSVLAALAGCSALVGLEDHERAPGGTIDAGACGHACGAGYACTPAGCANDVVGIAASATESCAVLAGGEVWCWGDNQLGSIGVRPGAGDARCGDLLCRTEPTRVPGIAGAARVAVGNHYACAVTKDGALWCWGGNAQGYLGHAPTTDERCARAAGTDAGTAGEDPCAPAPARVAFPVAVSVDAVAASAEVTCAHTSTKDVYCWGDNVFGAVGKSPPGGAVVTPTRVTAIASDALDVTIGGSYGHVCARRGAFALVSCWGLNDHGELGHPRATAGDAACVFGVPCNPTPPFPDAKIGGTGVAAGRGFTCVQKGDGTVACWGANDTAQLGDGESVDTGSHPVPAAVPGLVDIVAVEGRFETMFAIDGHAHVWSWGLSANGASGDGAPSGIACAKGLCEPKARVIPELEGAIEIASSAGGGLARRIDGTVWAWGMNDVAQLGHAPGTRGDGTCDGKACSTVPVRVVGLP
jgi:alpha-tubulin suppressor-like RCC1 family protein